MAARRLCSEERLGDVLTLRVSPKIRAKLERISDIENISVAAVARNVMAEGLRVRNLIERNDA